MITSMFALSTVYWILSLVVTFLVLNMWQGMLDTCYNTVSACYSGLRAPTMLSFLDSPAYWVQLFSAILLINVSTSTVQCSAEYRLCIQSRHPRASPILTRLP
jgi:hypothetical protein